MTSLPPNRCGFSSAAAWIDSPVSRSTSSRTTVVVPTSMAHAQEASARPDRADVLAVAVRRGRPRRVTAGSSSERLAPPGRRRMRRRRRRTRELDVAPVRSTSAWQASRKRRPQERLRPVVGGDSSSPPRWISTTHSRQRPVRRHEAGTTTAELVGVVEQGSTRDEGPVLGAMNDLGHGVSIDHAAARSQPRTARPDGPNGRRPPPPAGDGSHWHLRRKLVAGPPPPRRRRRPLRRRRRAAAPATSASLGARTDG